ncbi:hypothetical protein FRC20_005064 [Serendipita sp. 405]|nr:hypothetical protein FRC20_005064 [Serendipita sp. 405]
MADSAQTFHAGEHYSNQDATVQYPTYNISRPPSQVLDIELGPCCRSAKWCSDGEAILTGNEDRFLDVYSVDEQSDSPDDNQSPSLSKRSFRQGSPIYETAWYPYATPRNPSTYCFLASLRDTPIRLVDATDGRLRASYKIVDHRERFVAPHSIAFNLTAQKFYCGFLDAIEVFDLSVPGEGTRLHTIPSKKSRDGLRGIISSLVFCPDHSGLFAAGTFSSSIGMLSEDTGGQILMYLDDVKGPVSQLLFHPTNPRLLFARFRHEQSLYVWDVRNTSQCYSSLKGPITSSQPSNQRRYFDIDSSGRWLVDGDQDGNINIYKVDTLQSENKSVLSFRAHEDAISTAVFRPTKAMVLSVSGSRRFDVEKTGNSPEASGDDGGNIIEISDDEEEDGATDSDSDSGVDRRAPRTVGARSKVTIGDSRMKLWQLSME